MANLPGHTLWPSGTLALREPRLMNGGNQIKAAKLAAAPAVKVKKAKTVNLSSMLKVPRV